MHLIRKIIAMIDIDKSEINGPVINENGNKIRSKFGILLNKTSLCIINLDQPIQNIKIYYS